MKIKEGIFTGNSDEIVTTVDIGAIVRRGPDWEFGNQGGGGCGTIISSLGDEKGWVNVKWDNGDCNCYSIVKRDGYHLIYA